MAAERINELPVENNPNPSDNVPIDGATTRHTTVQKFVLAGRPTASQAEAEAGTDPLKAMTPLTTKQSIAAEVGSTIASATQGELAQSALQPSSIGATVQGFSERLDSLSGALGTTGQVPSLQPDGTLAFGNAGAGDMVTAQYDPESIGADAFDTANQVDFTTSVVSTKHIPSPVMAFRTSGYNTPGDGGACLYNRVDDEPTHAGKVQSADGSWWEIAETSPTPAMFGARAYDATFDSAAAIQSAYGVAGKVRLDKFYYVGAAGVSLTGPGSVFGDDEKTCGLKPITGITNTSESGLLNLLDSGILVERVGLNGDNRFRFGVMDIGGANEVRLCEIGNLFSTTASAVGIECQSLYGSTYHSNKIHDIESVGDTITGNNNGAARGIVAGSTEEAIEPCRIYNNEIWNITGEEGDGIQIIYFDGTNFLSSQRAVIDSNIIRQCSKRAIKIQAHDVSATNNKVDLSSGGGADQFCGIDSLNSDDVQISGNEVTVTGTMRGINVTAGSGYVTQNPVVRGNRIRTNSAAQANAIFMNAFERASVSDNDIDYGNITLAGGTSVSAKGNVGRETLANGTVGFIQVSSTVGIADVDGNTVESGVVYSVVSVQGPKHMINGNKRLNDGRCVYVVGAGATGNILVGNSTASTTFTAIAYSGTTSAAQRADVNNFNQVA